MNEVVTDFVNRLKYTRDNHAANSAVPDLQNELSKWAIECKSSSVFIITSSFHFRLVEGPLQYNATIIIIFRQYNMLKNKAICKVDCSMLWLLRQHHLISQSKMTLPYK